MIMIMMYNKQADALLVFLELYDAVVDALDTIALNVRDKNTSSAAHQLCSAISDFSFLVAVHVASNLLSYTKPLSVKLQQAGLDLCKAMTEVNDVISTLQNLREKTDTEEPPKQLGKSSEDNVDDVNQLREIELESIAKNDQPEVVQLVQVACEDELNLCRYDSVYKSATDSAMKRNIVPSLPRMCGKQIHRSNVGVGDPKMKDPEVYYRVSLYFPFLDHLLQGLRDRFGPVQQQIALASKLVPSIMVSGGGAMMSCSDQARIIAAFPDMPSPLSFASEYHRWFCRWSKSKSDAANVISFTNAYTEADPELYPNICTVMTVSATRPTSTAGSERSFSALKRLKTYIRSTMTEDRLTGLAMLHVHRNVHLDVESVIDHFAQLGPHRLAFI